MVTLLLIFRGPTLMQNNFLVSVVLPARNASTTITLAIRSILSQEFQDFEFLILDDGSTDETRNIVSLFNDRRIRFVSDGQQRGLATRLNQAVGMARGQYIARMDADDVSFPERLGRQVDFLEKHSEIDLVGCRAVVFQGEGEIVGLLPFAADHPALCANPWRNIPLPHPTWMGRADWFRRFRYRLPEVRRAEDQELLLRAYPSSRFACLADVLLAYRQGPFDLSKTLVARRSLLQAQIRLFSARREWGFILLALMLGLVKTGVDIGSALPGCDRLYFMRMAGKVPPNVKANLMHVLTMGS